MAEKLRESDWSKDQEIKALNKTIKKIREDMEK